MSGGKGSSTTIPTLSDEQKQQIALQSEFFKGTIQPTYKQAVEGASKLYESLAPGAEKAAQGFAKEALSAQDILGETGESALRTGVTGLQSLFTPDYERQQIMAALAPAQAQYQKNIGDLRTQFGATGNLGSARQALAERATAGAAAGQQAQTAAQIQRDIAAQRLQAAQALTGAGAGLVPAGVAQAGQVVTANMAPQDLYNKYASVIFGTPSASWNPNFAGTQGSTTSGYNFGFDASKAYFPGFR